MAINIINLEKSFSGRAFKLGPINFSIKPGEVHALFGHNGAGKSTLFQLMTGNMDPDNGKIEILGEPMKMESYYLKQRIGYLPQHLTLPDWVTPKEILRYASHLYNLNNSKEIIQKQLEYWDCYSFLERPVNRCSHGMQKRVSLALATIHKPEVLILDEPFSGLDFYHIRSLKNMIHLRQKENKITIVCTHMAPYAAELCNRASVLWKGELSYLPEWQSGQQSDRIKIIESKFS